MAIENKVVGGGFNELVSEFIMIAGYSEEEAQQAAREVEKEDDRIELY